MTTETTLNGMNLEQMQQTVAALQANPALARFEFRAQNRWIDGGLNRSTIRGFYGAGAEDESRAAAFVYDNSEPPVLLGGNESANPVEFLLHALAGCVTTTTVLHATARGIRVNRIETTLEGDLDLQGFLDLDPEVHPGYERIRFRMSIDADASDEELRELVEFTKEHSPVCNTISRPVPVELALDV